MAKKQTLSDILAKELGYRDAKELKRKISQRGGQDYASNVKGRLESGQGFVESFSESTKDIGRDIKESFSKSSIKSFGRKSYMSFFSGDDIFNAYMRGLINKKKVETAQTGGETESSTEEIKNDEESNAYLNIIAKNSMSLHLMSRDMNVLRQNIVKLTKFEAEKYNKDKKAKDKIKASTKADAFFLKEDERERALEAQKQKYGSKTTPTKIGEKKESKGLSKGAMIGGGLLGGAALLAGIVALFSDNILESLKEMFSLENIKGFLSKVFDIIPMIKDLFNGLVESFIKWKESGEMWKALENGFATFIEAISFGLIPKDKTKELIQTAKNFFDDFVYDFKKIFYSAKDWIVNNVGIPEIKLGVITNPFNKEESALGSLGPYYPFKKNPRSAEDEVTDIGARPSSQQPVTPTPQTSEDQSAAETSRLSRLRPQPTEDESKKYQELKVSLENSKINYKNEKSEAVSRLNSDTTRFPNGISLDPASPDYPKELKDIDRKYEIEIKDKLSQIRKLEVLPQFANLPKEKDFSIEALFAPQRVSAPGPVATAPSPVSSAPSAAPMPSPSAAPSAASTESPSGGSTPSASPSPTAAAPSAPTVAPSAAGGVSSGPSLVSGGGGEASGAPGTSSLSASQVSPIVSPDSPDLEPPTPSSQGSAINAISTQVADEQRMEGRDTSDSIINAPVSNSTKSFGSTDRSKPTDVYDTDFLERYSLA